MSDDFRVYFATGQVNDPEPDPAVLPFHVEVNLRPPGFMEMTFVMLYGGSEIVKARAATLEIAKARITGNEWDTHSRLRRIVITGPDNFTETIERRKL